MRQSFQRSFRRAPLTALRDFNNNDINNNDNFRDMNNNGEDNDKNDIEITPSQDGAARDSVTSNETIASRLSAASASDDDIAASSTPDVAADVSTTTASAAPVSDSCEEEEDAEVFGFGPAGE